MQRVCGLLRRGSSVYASFIADHPALLKKKKKKKCSERPFLNGYDKSDHPWETHVIPKRMASPT